MILGDIRHYESEKHLYPPAVQRGIEYIIGKNLGTLAAGKYELEGDLMFALVQEPTTQPTIKQKPESHETYTDIQYLASGEEKIGVVRHAADYKVMENKIDSHDVMFYEHIANETELLLNPGMFAVFFPSDIHRPCCSVNGDSPLKKVVIKIHKQLLQEI